MTKRASTLVSLNLILLAVACNDTGTIVTEPCRAVESVGWAAETFYHATSSRFSRCPTTFGSHEIQVGSFAVIDIIPAMNPIQANGGAVYAEVWVKNSQTYSGVPHQAGTDVGYFLDNAPYLLPGGGQAKRANVEIIYTSANYAQAGKTVVDSFHVKFLGAEAYSDGYWSWLYVLATVKVSSTPGYVLGPQAAQIGTPTSWRVQPQWDTTGYYYQWYVDGVKSSADTFSTIVHTFSALGAHVLRADQILADSTVLTTTYNVTAPLFPVISGPTSLEPNSTGNWSVYVPNGTAPLSIQWFVNSSYAGAGPSYSTSFSTPASSQSLEVFVTDNLGHTGSASQWVNITTGSCPGCNEQIRVPSTTPTKPARPMRGRPQ